MSLDSADPVISRSKKEREELKRVHLWQATARCAIALIGFFNAIIGLTEPTSLAARALGPDPTVDIFQGLQIVSSIWIALQAFDQTLRRSRYASVPFCILVVSFHVQCWTVIFVGLSPLLAVYYIVISLVCGACALVSATAVPK